VTKIFPFPVLSPKACASFRGQVGPQLADIYDEWREVHREQCDSALQRGDTLAEIEVNADALERFGRTTGKVPNLKNLLYFTIKKSGIRAQTPPKLR
jgi:hypothetical protein